MYRYDPSKNEWRKFSSPTQPGPRAAHQMVGTVAGGGRLWVHGGEYCEWGPRAAVPAHRPSSLTSNPHQLHRIKRTPPSLLSWTRDSLDVLETALMLLFATHRSFYHYHDLWSYSIESQSWERWETKVRPSARSGHRMAVYKNFIFLFGVSGVGNFLQLREATRKLIDPLSCSRFQGFQDTGIRTTYLNDLWAWSLTESVLFSPEMLLSHALVDSPISLPQLPMAQSRVQRARPETSVSFAYLESCQLASEFLTFFAHRTELEAAALSCHLPMDSSCTVSGSCSARMSCLPGC